MLVEVTRYVPSTHGYEACPQLMNTDEIETAYRDFNPPRGMGYAGEPKTKVRTRSGDEFWINGNIDQLIPEESDGG